MWKWLPVLAYPFRGQWFNTFMIFAASGKCHVGHLTPWSCLGGYPCHTQGCYLAAVFLLKIPESSVESLDKSSVSRWSLEVCRDSGILDTQIWVRKPRPRKPSWQEPCRQMYAHGLRGYVPYIPERNGLPVSSESLLGFGVSSGEFRDNGSGSNLVDRRQRFGKGFVSI